MMETSVTDELRGRCISELLGGGCSLVAVIGGELRHFHKRGVADLHELVTGGGDELAGAFVADKVVGKGAAALMAVGGVAGVYAATISRPALELLECSGVDVEYGNLVDNIINRAGTGVCPVESLCSGVSAPEECLPLITRFLESAELKRI